MVDNSSQKGSKHLEYTDAMDTESIKKELDILLEEKLDRISETADTDSFEEELKRKAEELKAAKEAHYREKGGRLRSVQQKLLHEKDLDEKLKAGKESDEHVRVYAAKAALNKSADRKVVSEGWIHRTWRLFKTLAETRKEIKGKFWYTQERRDAVYAAAFQDCWGPAINAVEEMGATAWNFFTEAMDDLWDLVLILADFVIAIAWYLGSFLYYVWDLLWDVRYWVEMHRKHILSAFAGCVGVAVVSIVLITSMTAYEYSYHGKYLGVVKSKDDVLRTIDALGDKLSKATGANVSMDVEKDMAFKKIIGFGQDVESEEDILDTLTYMQDLQVEAFAINVDGVETVILESEAVAKGILTDIQNDFAGAAVGVEYTEIRYEQDVTITPVTCALGRLWNRGTAKEFLEGNETKEIPGKVSIHSVETATYSEAVPFDVVYESTASLYADETMVKTPGIEGRDVVVATIERVNGEEVSRVIVSTTRVAEPVSEVQYKGTKPIPVVKGTGQFMYPLRSYTISSYYGMRWGRMHTGIDLAAPNGQKIYAADGGTVTFAGWKNSYGYIVIIDHGGLYTTYYAHCSQLLVSAGQNVVQGQNIALVGSTGYSTGPHCHFEIRYNDSPQNPLNYL